MYIFALDRHRWQGVSTPILLNDLLSANNNNNTNE